MVKYSLSDVIYAMEKRQQTEDWDVRRDAIHYLKLFQIDKTFDKLKENPPLTWDELLYMKGKPVWLDMDEAKWIVILSIGTLEDGTRMFTDSKDFYDMKDYGKKWMPYRKERYD